MATVRAYIRIIRANKNNKPTNVRFRLRDGRDFQLFHSSELEVLPDRWDDKQQKIKARCVIDEVERQIFDTAVNDRKALIKNIYLDKGKSLTSELLKIEIEKVLDPEKHEDKSKKLTLFQFIDKFIENTPNRRDKKTGRALCDRIIQHYQSSKKHLMGFAVSVKKKDFEFAEINQSFYDKFVAYLQSIPLTLNGVGKHIKILKTFLNDANTQGYNNTSQHKRFYVFSEDVDSIYLTETELQQLKDVDFSENQKLERVRDWFLLLAWTGCRFSDLEKVSKTDIKDGFITFRQQKTNTKVTIPLHPVVIEILEKYNFDLPKTITNAKFNINIKEVCKIAKINSSETMTRTVGGKLTTEKFEKWQRVSSHTGRRSFCTNMYKRGLPTLMIMSISGHKTEGAFLKYIKIKQDEHAGMMKKAWEGMYK